MRAAGVIRRLAERFGGDRRGNFGMMLAVVAPTLMLAAGYGLNVAQLVMTRSNLLAALDSAVTSTARDLTTGAIAESEARSVVEAFLLTNGARGFAETDRISLDSLVIDKATKTLSAEASVVVDIAFPLFGIPSQKRISTESAAVYSDRKIEVVMMLDVTGSMAKTWSSDKIGDLRTAASNAVTQLLSGNKGGGERIRVSLVPYAEAVNAGALAARTVYVEQSGGRDLPPPVDSPLWASASSRPDNCATERKLQDGSADFSDDSPYSLRYDNDGRQYQAMVNRDDRVQTCPTAQVVPLTADQSRLLSAIGAFTANGYTAGGIAAQWGYYMLSPEWRTAIADAGLGSGPAAFDRNKIAKVAILMTDGEFNTAFAGVTGSPRGSQTTRSPANAEAVCRRMKQDGIEIFTIGFALPASESSAARSVLRNCASPDSSAIRHFHEASNGEELDATFREIVANVERLALTK